MKLVSLLGDVHPRIFPDHGGCCAVFSGESGNFIEYAERKKDTLHLYVYRHDLPDLLTVFPWADCSHSNLIVCAQAFMAAGDLYGWDNIDDEPLLLTVKELKERWFHA